MKLGFAKNRAPFSLLAIWLFWSLILLVSAARSTAQLMTDPDDFMRMVQVRDWLSGQSWFDVTQYRIHPPQGGSMHWSRLLDVPIAGVMLLGNLIGTPQSAELSAIIIVPLALFGCLMLLVFGITNQLANEKIALLAAFLLPTYPLILRQFLPGRVDHHSWQILMAGLALFAFFRTGSKKSPIILGGAIAFWMHVSIEGLPYAVIFGSILAIFYLFPKLSNEREGDNRLVSYLNSLALFSAVFFIMTQSPNKMTIAYCDAVSWPLLATLMMVSAGMSVTHIFTKGRPAVIKAAAMGLTGAAGIMFFLVFSDTCALNPFGQLSPLVQHFWHETISEGLPVTKQAGAIVTLLIFVPLTFAIWIIYLISKSPLKFDLKKWLSLSFFVVSTSILSLNIQRTAGVAELFALPGLAALTASIVYRTQMSKFMFVRVFATVFAIAALSPMTSFVAANTMSADTANTVAATGPDRSNKRDCSMNELSVLEPGLIFTTMAAGPEILYRTKHTVFASGYHRNHVIMDQLIATMLGPTDKAFQTLHAAHVRYVVFCPTHFEAQSYLRASKDGFASMLTGDRHPEWLQPVPAFANSKMRVFRFENSGQ